VKNKGREGKKGEGQGREGKEERSFILAHGCRGLSQMLPGSIALGLRQGRTSWCLELGAEEAAHHMTSLKQRERESEGPGTRYTLQGHTLQ
jgi:hypothetical protein